MILMHLRTVLRNHRHLHPVNVGLHTRGYKSVKDFYKDRSVLVTGSTGFVGQCLVEKLLRSCPDIRRIYLPIRATKKGYTETRFKTLLDKSVFDSLRKINPDFSNKLVPLETTLEEPNLGLSDEVLTDLAEEISVIFHVAALIKFSPSLREAYSSNILASANLLRFGKRCNNLAAFVYTSTLFAHMDLDFVEEKVYPKKWNHLQLADLDAKKLESRKIAKEVKGSSMNIYYATKGIAEYMMKIEAESRPVAVVRPGKVSPSYKEPLPGWSHGFASYVAWMHLVEKGDVTIHMGREEGTDEVHPVDICANTLITSAWYIGTNQDNVKEKREPFVVNLHSSKLEHMTSSYIVSVINQCLKKDGRQGYLHLYTSRYRVMMRVVMPTLIRTIQELFKGEKAMALRFYAFVFLQEGIYRVQLNNNAKELKNLDKIISCLSNSDKEDFYCDLAQVDWDKYLRQWFKSLKERRESKEAKN